MLFFSLAMRSDFPYVFSNTPAMPLPFWYAHFGGFFYARRNRA